MEGGEESYEWMMQRKLDNYFTIRSTPKEGGKKDQKRSCFIYDPEHYRAYYTNKPLLHDQYLTKKLDVSLYYRPPLQKRVFPVPAMRTMADVPLLKSNLQKAIRRGHILEAVQSALAILQRDPMEFFRRLPVIYIEDVCLMDSYSILVWLMMAEKEHVLDSMDIDILLRIVKYLCDCMTWYDDSENYTTPMEISPVTLEHNDAIRSVYYRSLYGGMKGDMAMLLNSIHYYLAHPRAIQMTVYDEMDYDYIGSTVTLLDEAIDFHPFPQMLTHLATQTGEDKQDIRMAIWRVVSAINMRKPATLEESKKEAEGSTWEKIADLLPRIRRMVYRGGG